jgi:hypothetical protein
MADVTFRLDLDGARELKASDGVRSLLGKSAGKVARAAESGGARWASAKVHASRKSGSAADVACPAASRTSCDALLRALSSGSV